MLLLFFYLRRFLLFLPLAAALLIIPVVASGQDNPSTKAKDLHDRLKPFTLSGAVPVKELTPNRDRRDGSRAWSKSARSNPAAGQTAKGRT
jgi:hypothetical protein